MKSPDDSFESSDLPACPPDLEARAVELGDRFARMAPAVDHDGAFPEAEFALLHRAGLLAAPLATGFGGSGLGFDADARAWRASFSLLRVLEEVGRGNLAVGRLYEGHVNALLLIQQFGRPDQVAEWSADARRGRVFGVWNSQGGDGVRFGATDGGGRIALLGSKTFASGAGHIARPIVTGLRPDDMLQMAVVPVDEVAPVVDTAWWRPLGMRASASHLVDFAGVRVDRDRSFLGEAGSYLREPWFSGGSIRFAAVQLGGARAILDATVASLREWGRADDPFQRARVGLMAVAIEGGRHWLRAAAEVADAIGPDPDASTTARTIAHARMTRTAIEAACQEVLKLAEQSLGARGLIRPHPVERIGRDLTLYLRQPGFDSSLTQIGKALLEAPAGPDHAP